MPARFMKILFIVAMLLQLSGCGQAGALYIPPTCSPVAADGTIRQKTDENGDVLPPCPPPEIDAEVEAEDVVPLDNTESGVDDDIELLYDETQ